MGGNILLRRVGVGGGGGGSGLCGIWRRTVRRMTLDHCDGAQTSPPLVWLPLVPEDCLPGRAVISWEVGLGLYCYWALLSRFIVIIQFQEMALFTCEKVHPPGSCFFSPFFHIGYRFALTTMENLTMPPSFRSMDRLILFHQEYIFTSNNMYFSSRTCISIIESIGGPKQAFLSLFYLYSSWENIPRSQKQKKEKKKKNKL